MFCFDSFVVSISFSNILESQNQRISEPNPYSAVGGQKEPSARPEPSAKNRMIDEQNRTEQNRSEQSRIEFIEVNLKNKIKRNKVCKNKPQPSKCKPT